MVNPFAAFLDKVMLLQPLVPFDENMYLVEMNIRQKHGEDFVYIPPMMTRLQLLALCSLNRLPIYMGSCQGQPFNSGNQSYGHTLNDASFPLPTFHGFIRTYTPETAVWTDDESKKMSVEEVLYIFFVTRESNPDFDETIWSLKDQELKIGCCKNEVLVYYPGTGWEIRGESTENHPGLRRDFIHINSE